MYSAATNTVVLCMQRALWGKLEALIGISNAPRKDSNDAIIELRIISDTLQVKRTGGRRDLLLVDV